MKFRLIFILLVVILSGCAGNSPQTVNNSLPESGTLTVSAAASLKNAFFQIALLYKEKTGKTINFNFGASGALQKQIEAGAPVDIFASASAAQMDELAAKNLIDAATRRDFARNTLVLIVPMYSKLPIYSFADLTKPAIQKIAVGNPKTVPAGQYTEQVFDKLNLKASLQSKLIFGEDVQQVLGYVVRGETDAGVVYASDALLSTAKVRNVATAAEDAHAPILYPIAVIKDSNQKQAAQEFIDLVLSAEGQSILQKYGFSDVNGQFSLLRK